MLFPVVIGVTSGAYLPPQQSPFSSLNEGASGTPTGGGRYNGNGGGRGRHPGQGTQSGAFGGGLTGSGSSVNTAGYTGTGFGGAGSASSSFGGISSAGSGLGGTGLVDNRFGASGVAGNRFRGAGFGGYGAAGEGLVSASSEAIAVLSDAVGGGGVPGEDYPILSSVPDTGFSCEEQLPGYYADTDEGAGCQVRHCY